MSYATFNSHADQSTLRSRPVAATGANVRFSVPVRFFHHLQDAAIAILATVLALWSWETLPATQQAGAIAAWFGIGALALSAIAVTADSGLRVLASIALAATTFWLAYASVGQPVLFAFVGLLSAIHAVLLSPREGADLVRSAAWHYAFLAIIVPLVWM